MSNFDEFDRPIGPEKDTSSIISHAFENYKGVLIYGILYIIIAFFIEFLLSLVFPGSSLSPDTIKEIIESSKSGETDAIKDIILSNQDISFGSQAFSILASLISGALLYPLTAGMVYINHKNNSKQQIEVTDLFIGYKQNTLNLMLYGLVISVLASIGTLLCVIPGIYIYIIGFVGLPIVFFGNKNLSEGLNLSFSTTNQNLGLVLGVAILGFLISISGVLLCGIGILLTLPFIYSASYSLYCALFGTPYEIKSE